MKKTGLILAVSFLTFLSLGALAMVNFQPELKEQLADTYTSLFDLDEKPNATLLMPEAVEVFEVPDLKDYKARLRKNSYPKHLATAEEKGAGLILDDEQLFQLVEAGMLVEVSSGIGYEVEKLTHSHPYLTPEAKKVLEEIGQTYEALVGDGEFFTVTSGTRTIEQQKKLGRRNRNATKGTSSHSYGLSVDISYIRFNGEKSWNWKKRKKLEKVLSYFQEQNKIYAIKERKQNCFHITFR